MNSKVISRLCIFFFGVPAVIALIMLNQINHIAIHCVITLAACAAAAELYHLFSHNFKLQNKWLIISLTFVIHLSMAIKAFVNWKYPESIAVFNDDIITYVYLLTILISLGWEVLSQSSFEDSNSHLVTSISILTYMGLMFTYLSRMTFFLHSREVLIMFLTMVFFCDSLAWFFGVLFGKNNKGFIKASPNKSIAGFCGGIFGSMLSGALCWYLWHEEIFTGSIYKLIGLGAVMAVSSIIGDLVESVFKRSADCKDSGNIVPGRGGILDSVDSIVFSAPVFYCAVIHLYPSLIKTVIQ